MDAPLLSLSLYAPSPCQLSSAFSGKLLGLPFLLFHSHLFHSHPTRGHRRRRRRSRILSLWVDLCLFFSMSTNNSILGWTVQTPRPSSPPLRMPKPCNSIWFVILIFSLLMESDSNASRIIELRSYKIWLWPCRVGPDSAILI